MISIEEFLTLLPFALVGKSSSQVIYVLGSKAEIKALGPGSVHYLSYAFPHDWVTVT